MFIKNSPKEDYKYAGRTETIPQNLNPDFKGLIKLDYYFEKNQYLLFRAENQDDGGKTDLIGAVEVKLGTILTSPNS